MSTKILPSWAKDVLGVYNISSPGPYKYWYDFIRQKLASIPGDLMEIGVFKGRTFSATCSLVQELYPDRTVYGFDSFAGFPDLNHPFDQLQRFDFLYENSSISKEHYLNHKLNLELINLLGRSSSLGKISTSSDFSATSEDFVRNKLEYLGVNNYKLIVGDVKETVYSADLPSCISAIFLDADLYEPYHHTLTSCWPKLSQGGIIFLDEYYSLKFPGPRFAVNEFLLLNPDASLVCIEAPIDTFERWIIVKA